MADEGGLLMGLVGKIASPDSVTRHKPTTVEMQPIGQVPRAPRRLEATGKRFWKTYWASPVAQALDDVDHEVLERLCRLYDCLADIEDPIESFRPYKALSSEARSLEAQLGVTPASRARLGIHLAELKKATTGSIRDDLDRL
jgi:phage terminase small subunit